MLFNSFSFIAFLCAVVLFHSLPLPWTVRKANLLAASYLFYATWGASFAILLVLITVSNWWSARLIGVGGAASNCRKWVLWSNIALNIGVLSFFKYGEETLVAWNSLARLIGLPVTTLPFTIVLPVGLSFFTLQALSYTIDVYRRTIPPAASFLDFALFVAFFPVLLAGPLLRAESFLPQCASPRRASLDDLGLGATLVTLGLFMKIALADFLLAPIAHQVFAPDSHPGTISAWVGTIAFAGQDYCDFSGYATCALGIGLCLGFTLPENFRAPFASVGFRDLWQRWHITLVAWMRDYVFQPLGGVYKGYRRAAVNVVVVFLLIGVWHGASATYITFGLLHACYLIGEVALSRARRRTASLNGALGWCAKWLITIVLCCLAFVPYRAESLLQSVEIWGAMSGIGASRHLFDLNEYDILITLAVIQGILIVHWLRRDLSVIEVLTRMPWWLVALCIALMSVAMLISAGEPQSFLYFRY